MGLNTKQDQVFKLFAVTAAMLLLGVFFTLLRAPKVTLACSLPARATAGRPLAIPIRLTGAQSFLRPLFLSFPRDGVAIEPRQSVLVPEEDLEIRRTVTLRPEKRGRYLLRGPTLRSTDPLGLVGSRALRSSDQVLFVYPRFYSMESFRIPLGRRYQPGGIPLASHTGDSLEFLGTREYRQGDPIKHIHWRSWARVGASRASSPVMRPRSKKWAPRSSRSSREVGLQILERFYRTRFGGVPVSAGEIEMLTRALESVRK